MTDVWFTSDLHLGHVRIVELAYRPFDTVDEMNDALIDNWNSVVRPSDHVFVLGDFAMGHRNETVPLAQHLKGYKFLIPGNHDHVWEWGNERRRDNYMDLYSQWFQVMPSQMTYRRGGPHEVLLCHFPYHGDHTDEERYQQARPVDSGMPLFHGHTHGLWKQNGNMIDVGVDSWDYTPVHIDVLMDLLRGNHG